MLELGVFGGAYFADGSIKEFPKSWFTKAKLSKTFDVNINRFKIESGLSRKEWIDKGWIFKEDPLGWFQWYCRFKNGRRIPKIDQIQIKRWKAFGDRHGPAVRKNCEEGDLQCRRRQRQALLAMGLQSNFLIKPTHNNVYIFFLNHKDIFHFSQFFYCPTAYFSYFFFFFLHLKQQY